MEFRRHFTNIEALRNEPLFKKCLLPDIVETYRGSKERGRDVFPAVRAGRMDFYHKGGKLFSYDKRSGFTTHNKYASVIRAKSQNEYVTDTNLQAINSFVEGYERIKENCSLYSGVEAIGVSWVYGNFSCAKRHRAHDVVILDIEISLRRDDESQDQAPGSFARARSDRIDLLLYDTKSGVLRFFEAKDFSNSEIRAFQGRDPRIVKQMKRYEKQLGTDHVREEILAAYRIHVEVINRLFRPEALLPMPEDIDPVPRLLLFGFDRDQLTGKLKDEIARLEREYDIFVYAIGDIKGVKPDTLYYGGKRRWQTAPDR